MLENFFQLGPIPTDNMVGSYDLRLVLLSYLVATFASYIALDLTGRLRDINNTRLSIALWLLGGSLAMGAGIWSMHFIGMLAFSMHMPMNYDPMWTALSMVVAIIASSFALFFLKKKVIHFRQLIFGGIFLGFAIAAMHYTGMHAMTISMNIHYLPGLFTLSIVIAIFASIAALWLALKSTQVVIAMRFRLKFVSAFIMGAAICGMHYTGMAAAIFTHKSPIATGMTTLDPSLMAMSIAAVTVLILSIAFIASTHKESLNQQMLLKARQAGKAEVAASVLHNVGNVLNSVNVSSDIIAEKIAKSKLTELTKLSALMNENKQDLVSFLQSERGAQLPEFISYLAVYWENERNSLMTEVDLLNKNIAHIKNIIATQQDISRTANVIQLEAIDKILEEAILISGIGDKKHGISLKREYINLKPVLIDKVKLLQILVNLLHNAKDALKESTKEDKAITIKATHKSDLLIIQISDNGIGIPAANLVKIFSYGYTTKKGGHGFGLHSSAISVKEMGGSVNVSSEGPEKGATFTMDFPCRT